MSIQLINILLAICLVVFVPLCALLLLLVLMQRSKQDGIGATFGSGFTESAFGAQTSEVLIKATNFLLTLFFILAILIGHLYSRKALSNPVQQKLLSAPPVVAGTPTPTSEASPVVAPASLTPTVVPATTSPVPTPQPTPKKSRAHRSNPQE